MRGIVMPEIQINCLAVTATVMVNVVFGFVWFTIIFGRAWANEMGFDPDGKKETSEMIKGMALMIVGNFFIAWVLAKNIAVWNPET